MSTFSIPKAYRKSFPIVLRIIDFIMYLEEMEGLSFSNHNFPPLPGKAVRGCGGRSKTVRSNGRLQTSVHRCESLEGNKPSEKKIVKSESH